jgi:S-methylmethionine-dependent homocysteine/selenocysteine methylase
VSSTWGPNKTLVGDCCLTQAKKIENVLQSRGHNKTLVGNCCLTQAKKIENVLQSFNLVVLS